jgi:hypothetical protein
MDVHRKFLLLMQSRILDAFNNHLMQIQNLETGDDSPSRDEIVEMLRKEAAYLEQKRDAIMNDINRYLEATAR